MAGERSERTPTISSLPPREYWQFEPGERLSLPTPLDHVGLVDKFALVSLVKSTISPDYNWASPFADDHHLQWPNNRYDQAKGQEFNPQLFRNFQERKILVPRVFHNWLHAITLPPPMPSEEVMHEYLESRLIVKELHDLVAYAKYLARRSEDREMALEFHLNRRFDLFADALERAKQTPKEFQVIDFDQFTVESFEDMEHISNRVGRHAVKTAPIPIVYTQPLMADATAA